MKKRYIAVGLIILIVISIFIVALLIDNKSTITNTPNEIKTDINVDGWLKITKIYECNGKLAVVAENLSDDDVEYAVLTVKNRNNSFTFKISVLLRETKVVLICNEDVGFDSQETYTGWKIEDVVYFENTPVLNDDKFELIVTDGSISVKNISGADIASDIFIYYKNKQDDMFIGSETHRIRISGLKADSQTYIKADGLNENNCQIIFTEYDKKI